VSDTPTAVCADCGAKIEHHRGNWAKRTANGKGWDYCCRVTYRDSTRNAITRADYHHVDGEAQRHFPSVEGARE
jgi:hypothetical protein